ncbi:MAG TPA: sigma-70 family RNA polymerase sigma factor, partial [Candidatus Dormibacteraeota bacterium]|nr:sigma-70 family RNA polymerase sigma factor [Candidatus Dormibacteraeota bacterium]
MAVYPARGGEYTPADLQDALAVSLGEVGWCPLLSPIEELRLARAARTGDRRAAARLVEANLRLVVAVARRYADRGVPFLDLVQEGNAGLLRAVREFDPALGHPFPVFASKRVGETVRRAAAERGGLIRVPAATVEATERLRRAAVRLSRVLGREPTDQELALELDTTTRRIARLVRLARPPLALQDLEGRPRVAEDDVSSPPDDVVVAALRVDLHAMLTNLTARERRVLQLRFGLVDGRRCSLEEASRRLGVARERVR